MISIVFMFMTIKLHQPWNGNLPAVQIITDRNQSIIYFFLFSVLLLLYDNDYIFFKHILLKAM